MAILSTVAYHKSGDPRITGVMDEAYAAALSLFRGMTAQAFNDYIVRRMATYLQSWPVDVKPVPAAEPAPTADADAGGAILYTSFPSPVQANYFYSYSSLPSRREGGRGSFRTYIV